MQNFRVQLTLGLEDAHASYSSIQRLWSLKLWKILMLLLQAGLASKPPSSLPTKEQKQYLQEAVVQTLFRLSKPPE